MSVESLVDEIDARLAPLDRAANTAWWDANVDANDTTSRRRAEADLAWSDALADPAAFAAIGDARKSVSATPVARRRLEVLEHMFAPQQVVADLRREIIDLQSDLESRFARHRGTIDGAVVDENAIREILRTSGDSAHRRAAWEASKTVGAEVAADVRRLVHLRNDAARALGYRDHFAMTLATSDFDEGRLIATLDEVDQITAGPFAELKRALDERLATRFGLDASSIEPWHYDDPFFQSPPPAFGLDLDALLLDADLEELTCRTFDGVGLDVRSVIARSDLAPRSGKVQHAFCVDIDRGGDVRVLCNNVPGEAWAETMLHEFGHAVYFVGVDRELPWALRTMDNCLTEGVAMRCGRLVHDPDWLVTIAGIPRATVAGLAPGLADARRSGLLVFARWVLVMTHFERGLYADPDGPHDERWWELVEHHQLVRRPDDRHEPDWAAKIHIAAAPVYYHNYLFGEMIASHLDEAAGSLVDRPDAGQFLAQRLFAHGASTRWDRLVEHATGAPLTPRVLARDLAR